MSAAQNILTRVNAYHPGERYGFVRKVSAGKIDATGPMCAVGDICYIETEGAQERLLAEVAGTEADHIILVPFDPARTIPPNARVIAVPEKTFAPVGNVFAGRAVNALGEPIDGQGAIFTDQVMNLSGSVLAPLERKDPEQILQTGLRTIDGLMPIGKGQRIGVFAAAGVGKTTLIRQLVDQVECDRTIMCLTGERGREVEHTWRDITHNSAKQRFSCVASTSDTSSILRARAVYQSLCMAEYWRDQGEDVLIVIDSVTRFAMALREIGLAAGAPPTLRAYTPNVFAELPRLVERCGGRKAGGSITAIVTVLSETDDVDDPIVEVMKSLLDGHIILSRSLAEQGHFPAIDANKSISRQSDMLMSESHKTYARAVLTDLALYNEARIMIESGVYRAGRNPELDAVIARREQVLSFLQQDRYTNSRIQETLSNLQQFDGRESA